MNNQLILTSLTNSELKKLINDAVRTAMIDFQPEPNAQEKETQTEMITEEELSKRINISKTTLWKWRKEGNIPFQRVGGKRILYDWNDVKESFIKSNQKERLQWLK
jgi:excisionase family DNA binding protein